VFFNVFCVFRSLCLVVPRCASLCLVVPRHASLCAIGNTFVLVVPRVCASVSECVCVLNRRAMRHVAAPRCAAALCLRCTRLVRVVPRCAVCRVCHVCVCVCAEPPCDATCGCAAAQRGGTTRRHNAVFRVGAALRRLVRRCVRWCGAASILVRRCIRFGAIE
jgi:hypothetical protein